MAQAKLLKPFLDKWEGGFVHDPADAGGATNKGVTLATYEAYCRRKGYPKPTVERLKNISDEQWFDIFKTMYWDKWLADKIQSQKVADILVDWHWMSGAYGIKIPQRVLGVVQDGIVGDKTIGAVNASNPDDLFNLIYDARKQYYDDIVSSSIRKYEERLGRRATESELMKHTNKRFLKGWMNRLNNLKNMHG